MSTDPIDLDAIEAGAEALDQPMIRLAVQPGQRHVIATAVLRAVLPGHDARLRAQVAEDIARALLAHDQRYPRDWIGGSDGATRAAAIARAHTTGGDHD